MNANVASGVSALLAKVVNAPTANAANPNLIIVLIKNFDLFWRTAGFELFLRSSDWKTLSDKTEAFVARVEQWVRYTQLAKQGAKERAKLDRKRRQHLVERSFADAANRHGFKRARWRGLLKQSIQDLLSELSR